MAIRDRFRTLLPGLSTDRYSSELNPVMLAREATTAMYQTMNGSWAVVPRLDISPRSRAATNMVMTNPLLLGPLFRVSRRMGSIPIKVWEFTTKDGRKEREEAMDHPAYDLLRKPNPDLTRARMISGTVLGMFVFTRIGWLKERRDPFGPSDPSNPPVALWPIPGPFLWVNRGEKRLITGYELRVPGRAPAHLKADDVILHDLGADPTSFSQGVNPLDALNEVADFGQEDISAMRKLFRTALLQRIWINLHGADLEDEARERLRGEMEQAASARGGVPVMESGATIESMGGGVDNQLLKDGLTIAKETILQTLGFPIDMDDPAKFYGEVIQPIADGMEQEWERTLMTEFPSRPAFPEFQFREILMGTPEQRAKINQIEILSAQSTPNETRVRENKPRLPGGDVLLAPLNVVVLKQMVDAAENPPPPAPVAAFGAVPGANIPKAATRGGFGGREGKVGQGTARALLPSAAARMVSTEAPKMRAQGRENWATVRTRIIDGRAGALERRLRGVVATESRHLRELVSPLDRQPPAEAVTADVFGAAQVTSVMAQTDAEVERLLVDLLSTTADDAFDQANLLMSDPTLLPDRNFQVAVSEEVANEMQVRASAMAEHFAVRRQAEVAEMLPLVSDQRDLVREIKARWGSLADHFVNVIGRNETAWAFEHAAAGAWAEQGYTELGIVRESANCRTGTCDDAAKHRYRTGDVPTPLHPGCNCLAVPAGLEE